MLKAKNLRNYLIADLISQIGSNLAFLSLHWHILEITHSNTKVGNAVLIGVIAGLITCPFAGIITDIFCRKKIILYSNFIRSFSILLATILTLFDQYNIFYFFLFFVIGGVGFNVYIPASKAFLQEIVSKDEYLQSSGFLEFNVQFSFLLSSLLSGILYKFMGMYVILAINIVSFLLANIFISSIDHVREFKPKRGEGFIDKLFMGIRYFQGKKWLLILIIILILPQIASIGQNIVLPGYVFNHLGADSITYGWISMFYGIGAAIISVIFTIQGENFLKRFMIELGFITSIISLVIIIFTRSLFLSYVSVFLFGFANAFIKIYLIAFMMKNIDKEYMGRAISIKNILITILQILTSYNIGLVMDQYGEITGYIFLEVIMLLSFCSFVVYRLYHPKN